MISYVLINPTKQTNGNKSIITDHIAEKFHVPLKY